MAKRQIMVWRMSSLPFVAYFFFGLGFANAKSAQDIERCEAPYRVGATCRVLLQDLHPTQFAVGFREVQEKIEKLSEKNEKELRKYLFRHLAPVVVGPDSRFYITDRHHLFRAAGELAVREVYVAIRRNWSRSPDSEFWGRMIDKNYVYLYDENGLGPADPRDLPARLDQLKDDGYRSLSAAVRDLGGYEKTSVPFAEFLWAQFFRSRIWIGPGERGFQKAVRTALKLAHSSKAQDLPGWKGESE